MKFWIIFKIFWLSFTYWTANMPMPICHASLIMFSTRDKKTLEQCFTNSKAVKYFASQTNRLAVDTVNWGLHFILHHWDLTGTFTWRHKPICKWLGILRIKCVAHGHITIWQKDVGITSVTSWLQDDYSTTEPQWKINK